MATRDSSSGARVVDAYLDGQKATRERRWWRSLITLLLTGIAAFFVMQIDNLPNAVQVGLAVYVVFAIIVATALLSTRFVFKGAFPALRSMWSWWPF